jgi:hypothetical protein
MLTEPGKEITWGELPVGSRSLFAGANCAEAGRPHPGGSRCGSTSSIVVDEDTERGLGPQGSAICSIPSRPSACVAGFSVRSQLSQCWRTWSCSARPGAFGEALERRPLTALNS